jgi:hypothetical protein
VRGAIEAGSLPIGLTLIPVHLVFLLIALALIFSQRIQFYLRRLLSSTQRGSA